LTGVGVYYRIKQMSIEAPIDGVWRFLNEILCTKPETSKYRVNCFVILIFSIFHESEIQIGYSAVHLSTTKIQLNATICV